MKAWHLLWSVHLLIIKLHSSKSLRKTLLRVPGVGFLEGVQHRASQGDQVRVFAGVPYAEAPVGDLRWRPPRQLPKSESLINATAFGPSCPQELGSRVVGDENCLTLNVFAPSQANGTDALLPVLVWFHGGGYVKGTANVGLNGSWGPLYSGEAFAAEGAVVVTVQYRLGALGFLGSSELRGRDATGSSGNYGIQDQRLALQWVRQHAFHFGGDPQRVLIFGQSAGAGSVSWHLAAEASRGLFHAAALQSGACSPWASQTWHEAEASFQALLAAVKCANVTCLLGVPVQELVLSTTNVSNQGFAFAPTIDGVEMADTPCQKVSRGEFAKVPMIVGFTREESTPEGHSTDMTEADFDQFLARQVPEEFRAQLKAEYSAVYSEWYWAARHLDADLDVSCPTRRFVRAAQSSGAMIFAYKFSRQPSFPVELMYGPGIAPAKLWGAYHGAELAFVFGNARVDTWLTTLSEGDQKLALAVSKHWLALARTGSPAAGWPQVTGDSPALRQWSLLDSPNVSVSEAQLLSLCNTVDTIGGSRSLEYATRPSLHTIIV